MKQQLLVTVTGPDHPGITARLSAILAEQSCALHDIEQVVVHGQLTLCLLISLENSGSNDSVIKELLFAAKTLGQHLEFRVLDGDTGVVVKKRHIITAIGDQIPAKAVAELAKILADYGVNIDSIRRLSHQSLQCLEILVDLRLANESTVKHALLAQMASQKVDIAIQEESSVRCNKRLVAFDMDSTLIGIEVMDELARQCGLFDKVSAITERAMAGELDFCESFRQRSMLLKNVNAALLDNLIADLPLSPGAERLITTLKRLGYQVGIISGGFMAAAERLKRKLDLDFAFANTLEVKNGVFTGQVTGSIIDASAKAVLLEQVAYRAGVPLMQTVAVGDGANDAIMLGRAGLGVAFYGKPALKACATASLNSGGLEKILYLLGVRDF